MLSGSPLSWTIALDLSTSGPWLKASALAFGRIVTGRPTPSAMTLNAMEDNTNDAAMIFFIDFDELKVNKLERRRLECQTSFP